MDFTHFDENGNAIMVDVSSKDTTQRSALAYGEIYVGKEILDKIEKHQMKKGDVLSVARIAGIMAVKRTSDIIPLCHPLLLSKITVDFNINHEKEVIETYCQVSCLGKTGVEMEALHGVGSSFAALFGVLPNTSFSQNVGLVTMTKIVNRFALACGAIFLIICGYFLK